MIETQTPTNEQKQSLDDAKVLPFSNWWVFLPGIAFGILMRVVVFGDVWNNTLTAMFASFIIGVPFVVGAITVYVAERQKRRTFTFYFWGPFVANALLVLGTLLIMIEGMICAIVIVPMFAVAGGVGGMAMGVVCRLTNWPKQAAYSLAALPLLLGMFEAQLPAPREFGFVEHSIEIAAPAEVIWKTITHTGDIQPEEFNHAWIYKTGVPVPISGTMREDTDKRVRKSVWARGINFDEPITEWQPNKVIEWTYRFSPVSFPKGSLDDHVMIGGKYFDLISTRYVLTPTAGGTKVYTRTDYRISTQFNFYSDWVAQLFLGNFSQTVLGFYKQRSEAEKS